MSMGIWDYINTHEMLRPHPFRITESWRLRLTQSQLPFAVTKIYLHFRLNAFLFYFYRPTWLLLFADTHMTKLTHTRREGTCFTLATDSSCVVVNGCSCPIHSTVPTRITYNAAFIV